MTAIKSKKEAAARIDAVKTSETSSRKLLGETSVDFYNYVVGEGNTGGDIESLNRLIGVLTPINAGRFVEFFSYFLPYKSEKSEATGKHSRFGTKLKSQKQIDKRAERWEQFMEDTEGAGDVFSWVKTKKPPADLDLADALKKAIDKCKKGNEERNAPAMTDASIAMVVLREIDANVMQAMLTATFEQQDAEAKEALADAKVVDLNTAEIQAA